jgi:ribosome-associated protein
LQRIVVPLKGKTLITELRTEAETPLSSVETSAQAPATSQLETVLASLEDSKAENIVPIDLRGKSTLGDHLVIASGRSHRHVAAVAEHLLTALKDCGTQKVRVEGMAGADWVLIDTGDTIIHVFRPEVREFYNLEKMWQTPDLDDGTKH